METKKEIWKDIKGYEGIYLVSDLGRIKSLYNSLKKRGRYNKLDSRILKTRTVKSGGYTGYMCVGLRKNNIQKKHIVHRLVAMAFIENPRNKSDVNHKNKIRTDNRVINLEWNAVSENQNHKNDIFTKQVYSYLINNIQKVVKL